MSSPFVPDDFDVPLAFAGPGFRLEPLGAEHNVRDHEAWMPSIQHIKTTPGFEDWDWPAAMSLEANLSDLVGHADDFENRSGFTYSILDGDNVIGCVYIYPARDSDHDAAVRSWVTATRAEMDVVTWRAIADWLATSWPFRKVQYSTRS